MAQWHHPKSCSHKTLSRLKLPRLDHFKFGTKLDRFEFGTKLKRFSFETKRDHFSFETKRDDFSFETKIERFKFETKLEHFKFETKLDHFWSRRSLVDSSVQIIPRPGFKTQGSGCDAVNWQLLRHLETQTLNLIFGNYLIANCRKDETKASKTGMAN